MQAAHAGGAKVEDIQAEVDRNYDEFRKLLPSFIATHRDKYALMKAGQILGFFSTPEDARIAAEMTIKDQIYSVQQVSNDALNMGYYTHALVFN